MTVSFDKCGTRVLHDFACDLFEEYRRRLVKMWDIGESWWVGGDMSDYETLCADDFFIKNSDLRYCVDNRVSLDVFTDWYDYHNTVFHGKELGMKLDNVNLNAWVRGYPDNLKLSKEKLREIEAKYWKDE